MSLAMAGFMKLFEAFSSSFTSLVSFKSFLRNTYKSLSMSVFDKLWTWSVRGPFHGLFMSATNVDLTVFSLQFVETRSIF